MVGNWQPFKWDTIANAHKTLAVRSLSVWFFVIPLLAKALSPLVEKGHPPTWLRDISLPFSWLVFFCAACALALATALYVVLCPPIIKDARGIVSSGGHDWPHGNVRRKRRLSETTVPIRPSLQSTDHLFVAATGLRHGTRH